MSQNTENTNTEVTGADLIEAMSDAVEALQGAQTNIVNVSNEVKAKAEEIKASNAAAPVPVWEGTSLHFESGDGKSLTESVDLKGPAPVMLSEVQVKTLDAGASATASLGRNGDAYTLSLGIPQGIQGEAGTFDAGALESYMPKAGGAFTGAVFEPSAALSGTEIDVSTAAVFSKAITGETAFTITGAPSGKAATFSLILNNGGAYTVTWPSSVKWAGGTPPTLTPSGVDVLTFLTGDGGTTWYGIVSSKEVA